MDFCNKVVLLTGASGGIGAGLARGLSEQGARLLLSSRSTGDLGRLIGELPYHEDAVAMEADLSKPGEASKLAARALETAGRVDVLRGDARTTLRGLPSASADACFIDADKEGYRAYLDECLRILPSGGLIMVDNAFAFGDLLDPDVTGSDVLAIRAFNDFVTACPELDAVILPLGDGLWVGVRR